MASLPAPIDNMLARLKGVPGDVNRTSEYSRLWESARRARLPYDKDAWLNLAFFNNQQYVEWAPEASTLREIQRPKSAQGIPRPVFNKIMHFVEQEHSMALQTRPNLDVLPASEDPGDVTTSNVAKSFLEWLQDETVGNMNREVAIATKWALAGTEGFIKWFWNPLKDRPDFQACGPFDLYIDPYAKKFSDCRYIIHSQFMDVEQVFDIYDKEVTPSSIEMMDPARRSIMHDMGFAPVLNGALVHELWMRPCRRYPKGLFVVWTNREILSEPIDFPYHHGKLPFTQIGSVLKPGTPHYSSAVTYLRAPQMELNKYHAQMIQVRQNFASPKWWLPDELDLETDPDDSPNQILRGNSQSGTVRPEIIQPAAMPPNDQGKWIADEMSDVVGLHEVSQAQVPGRVEAAKAIELLKEADDGRLAELIRTVASGLSEGGYQLLMLARQYMTAEQILTTYSANGLPEVQRFFAGKLDPGMRVRVSMGTGLSRSRAAREDTLMLMWNNGIIQDRQVMAELMDVPIASVMPSQMFAIRLARNENFTMADGTPVVPNSWDNHDIHRQEHNDFRMTQEFLHLSMQDKQIFEMHVTMHDQLEVQSLGQQLQRQALAAQVAQGAGFAQGAAPGGPGGAPAPGGQPGTSTPAVPTAMGAAPPETAAPTKNSPAAQASFQNRFATDLAKPGVKG